MDENGDYLTERTTGCAIDYEGNQFTACITCQHKPQGSKSCNELLKEEGYKKVIEIRHVEIDYIKVSPRKPKAAKEMVK